MDEKLQQSITTLYYMMNSGNFRKEYFMEVIEYLKEIEKIIIIGKATQLAMKDGSKYTVFANGIDYLLEFYEREKED